MPSNPPSARALDPNARPLRPDEPCGHPGCLHHVTHPCDGCGRIAGRYIPPVAPPSPPAGREPVREALIVDCLRDSYYIGIGDDDVRYCFTWDGAGAVICAFPERHAEDTPALATFGDDEEAAAPEIIAWLTARQPPAAPGTTNSASTGSSLGERADFTVSALRIAAGEARQNYDALPEWFNVEFLSTAADVIAEQRAAYADAASLLRRVVAWWRWDGINNPEPMEPLVSEIEVTLAKEGR